MIEKKYADYEKNGEIFCIVEGAPRFLDTENLLEVGDEVSDETHYVDVTQTPHVARERHRFDTRHDINDLAVSFQNLPRGTTIRVKGREIISDGDDAVGFDLPGTYVIELEHFQYMSEVVEVTLE